MKKQVKDIAKRVLVLVLVLSIATSGLIAYADPVMQTEATSETEPEVTQEEPAAESTAPSEEVQTEESKPALEPSLEDSQASEPNEDSEIQSEPAQEAVEQEDSQPTLELTPALEDSSSAAEELTPAVEVDGGKLKSNAAGFGVDETTSYIGSINFGGTNLVLPYSSVTGQTVNGQLVVKLPATATNAKIEVTLPIGMEWVNRGQDNPNVTSVATISAITEVPSIVGSYGTNTVYNAGKVTYTVNAGVDTITIPFVVKGSNNFVAQTFSAAEIIADVYYNNLLQDTSKITGIELESKGTVGGQFLYGSDFVTELDSPIVVKGASTGAVYRIWSNNYAGDANNAHVEDASFVVTPKSITTTASSDMTKWVLTNTRPDLYDMTHNPADGSYTFTRKSNYLGIYDPDFSIELPSSDFVDGDKITAEIQPKYVFYDDVVHNVPANAFTVKADSSVQIWANSVTNSAVINGVYTSSADFGNYEDTYGALSSFTFGNRGGSNSKPQEIVMTFDTTNIGINTFQAIVPTGQTRGVIDLIIKNVKTNTTRTIAYTGNTTASEMVTPYLMGLTEGEYVQEAKYVVSSISAGYMITTTTSTYLGGSIFNLGVTVPAGAKIEIKDAEDSTILNATGIINYNTTQFGRISASPARTAATTIPAGSSAVIRYNVGTGGLHFGVTRNPLIYFYNPSDGVVDLNNIKVIDVYGNEIPKAMLTITKLTGAAAKGAKELIVIDTAGVPDNRATLMHDFTTSKARNWRTMYVDIPITTTPTASAGKYLSINTFFVEDRDNTYGWNSYEGSSVDQYGLKQTSGAFISGVAGKNQGYFEIIPVTDITVKTASKLNSQSASAYTTYDGTNPTYIAAGDKLDIRTTIANYSGVPVKEATVYIPIPQKGEDWGSLMYTAGGFPFSTVLDGQVTNPDTNLYRIQYGTVSPTDDGNALNAQGFENWNDGNKDTYNCIRITNLQDIPFHSTGSNDYNFIMRLNLGGDLDLSSVDAWYPYFYENLTTSDGSVYKKWLKGEAIGVAAAVGTTVFHNDLNKGMTIYDNVDVPADDKTITSLSGSDIASVSVAVEPGYEFLGWGESASQTSGLIGKNGIPSGQLKQVEEGTTKNYYAIYREKTYTVTYDTNSGTPATIASLTGVKWADAGLLPAAAPTRSGYVFDGWKVTEGGPTTMVTATDTYGSLASNDSVTYIKLQAQWLLKSYTVSYDTDGGSPAVIADLTNLEWTSSDLLPGEEPVKTGYTFTGWAVSAGGTIGTKVSPTTKYSTVATNDATLSITLKAQYKANTYAVRYDTNGGVPATIAALTGVTWEQAGLLPAANPTKAGYTFAGWEVVEGGPIATATAAKKFSELAEGEGISYIRLQAQWTAGEYTVNYDANGGSPATLTPKTGVKWSDANLLTTDTVTKAGHTLSGWKVTTGGDGSGKTATILNQYSDLALNDTTMAITLEAQWAAKNYQVRYDTNGGTPGTLAAKTGVKWDDTGLLPATTPTRTGFTFAGWLVTDNGSYTLATAADAFSALATDDSVAYITLQAQWNENNYAVVYDTDGGVPGTITSLAGVRWSQDNLLPNADPVKTGYTFKGWKVTAGGPGATATATSKYSSLATDDTVSQITLTAQWTAKSYLVKYDINGGKPSTEAVKSGVAWEDAGLLPATTFTRDGYTFDGWLATENANYTKPDSTTKFSALAVDDSVPSITLQAQWKEVDYTVTYDVNQATSGAISDLTGVRWGDTGLLPDDAPTREGYTLTGWKVSAGGTAKTATAASAYSSLATDTSTLSITLQAQWTAKKYTVRYDTNGGSPGSLSALTGLGWGDVGLLPAANPTRAGYTFDGWTVFEGGPVAPVTAASKYNELADNDQTMSITLQAQWKGTDYQVVYDTNGGTPSAITTRLGVKWSDAELLPSEDVTRTGYTFTGWRVSAGGTDKAATDASTYSQLATDDTTMSITLQAQWKAKSYSVAYDTDGGTPSTINTLTKVTWEQASLLPAANPMKKGYDFSHWEVIEGGAAVAVTTASKYSELADDDSVMSIRLQARWILKTYTVTYDINGGTSGAIAPLTSVLWEDVDLLPDAAPTRTGYTLTGWRVSAGGPDKTVTAASKYSALATDDATMSITLQAQWKANTYRVNYDTNGGLPGSISALTGVTWEQASLLPAGNPTRKGHTFTGWDIIDGGSKNNVQATDKYSELATDDATASITLQAQWLEVDYSVVYDTNGGTPTSLATRTNVKWADTGLLPDLQVTRPGFELTGWKVSAGGALVTVTDSSRYSALATDDTTMSVTLEAQWKTIGYTVRYDVNGGKPSSLPALTGVAWSQANLLPGTTPSRAGYTFGGWAVIDGGASAIAAAADTYSDLATDAGIMSITLQAQWEEISYTVLYDTNGGNPATVDPLTDLAWGDSGLLPNEEVLRPGYILTGWRVSAGGADKAVTNNSKYSALATDDTTTSITIQAQWQLRTYNVSYDTNGGTPTSLPPLTGVTWAAAGLLPGSNPTKAGYSFAGWQVSVGGNPLTQFLMVLPTDTYGDLALNDSTAYITLQAQWTAKGYTVEYDTNGGIPAMLPALTNVGWTDSGLLPDADPSREGYTFTGWKVSSGGAAVEAKVTHKYSSLAADDSTMSITLEAQWNENTYSVNYDTNGGQPASINTLTGVTWSQTGLLPGSDPVKAGYTFAGWRVTAGGPSMGATDGHAYKDLADNDGTKSITLTAQWTAKNYTVVYDTNGGLPATITALTGVKWEDFDLLPDSDPTRTGYTFTGWRVSAGGADKAVTVTSKYSTLAADASTEEITLQAQWTPTLYTVRYDTNGGSPASLSAKTKVTWTQTGLLPASDPTKTGYTFAGWEVTEGGDSALAENIDQYGELAADDGTKSITLTARWTARTYTVHYDTNGGTPAGLDDLTGVAWEDADLLPTEAVTRPGYKLEGWKVSIGGTARMVTAASKYSLLAANDETEAITLEAQWSAKSYTVTYDVNGGSPSKYSALTKLGWDADNLLPASDPTRTGYKFVGWEVYDGGAITLVSGTDKYSALATDDSVMTLVLQAQWENEKYQVKYDTNGGTPSAITTKLDVEWGDADLLPIEEVTRAGYIFDGWKVSEGGSPVKVTPTSIYGKLATNDATKSITLEAQWKQVYYTVTYDVNGGSPGTIAPLVKVTWNQTNLLPASSPTKTGSTFVKWTVIEGGPMGDATAADSYSALATDDGTLTLRLQAQWSENTYEVRYNTNGGEPSTIPTLGGVKWTDSELLPEEAPTYAGYEFTGWKVSAGGTIGKNALATSRYSALATDDSTASITLTAQWKIRTYSVHYDVNGGTPVSIDSRIDVHWMTDGLLPAEPTRAGHIFDGWKVIEGGQAKKAQSNDRYADLAKDDVTMSITLQAQWLAKEYTVEYDTNGGEPATITALGGVKWSDSELLPEENPTYAGHKFLGWKVSAGGPVRTVTAASKYSALATDDTTMSITIQAQWQEMEYMVKYDTNGGKPTHIDTKEEVKWYDDHLLPDDPARDGYTFAGWRVVEGGAEKAALAESRYSDLALDMETAFIKLEAQWTENTYTVHYDTAGGEPETLSSLGEVKWNDIGLLPEEVPIKTGYDFLGWKVTEGGAERMVKDTHKYASLADNDKVEAITLTAQWALRTYAVNYDTDGGTPKRIPSLNGLTWDTADLIPAEEPVRPGYTFQGWIVIEGGKNFNIQLRSLMARVLPDGYVESTDTYGDLAYDDSTRVLKLLADWEANEYTVRYDTNGGTPESLPSRQKVTWDDFGLLPVDEVTREGYEIGGWKVSEGGEPRTVAVTDTYSYLATDDTTSEITLQLQWKEKRYVVNYDTNGGTPVNLDAKTQVSWLQSELFPEEEPTRAGYTFEGWRITEGGPGKTVTPKDGYNTLAYDDTTKAIRLTAQWTAKKYTVTYDTKGGLPEELADYTGIGWEQSQLLPDDAPTKAGYTFTGWFLKDSSVKVSQSYTYSYLADGDDTVESVALEAGWRLAEDTKYKVEHYMPSKDGKSWALRESDQLEGKTGAEAAYTVRSVEGYTFIDDFVTYQDSEHKASKTALTIAADGSLVVRLYYRRDKAEDTGSNTNGGSGSSGRSGSSGSGISGGGRSSGNVKTGDETDMTTLYLLSGLMLASMAGAGGVLVVHRRRRRESEE